MTVKKAVKWVLFWFCSAMLFNLGIYLAYLFFIPGGAEVAHIKAQEFLGGYIIEQSLSVDNLFLFLLIFSSFGLSTKFQRRVLNFGIAGAIILRAVFIFLGVTLVSRFQWILYIFGVILIISGIKMALKEEEEEFKESKLIKFLRKIIPFTDKIENEKFFTKIGKKTFATPLLAILLIIETSDILFAIDSIPAIFSVTTDAFIVYSSNIFAILGLRSLYFLLERLHSAFRFVKYGVAVILMFTGVKLAILFLNVHISLTLSLGIIFGVLLFSILASVIIKEKSEDENINI